jgi:hypothetical protein
MYGSLAGYAEAASRSIAEAAALAQWAIMAAVYGTCTAVAESATSVIADRRASASSAVAEPLQAATALVGDASSAKVRRLADEPEQGVVDSAQSRLNAVVASACTSSPGLPAQQARAPARPCTRPARAWSGWPATLVGRRLCHGPQKG